MRINNDNIKNFISYLSYNYFYSILVKLKGYLNLRHIDLINNIHVEIMFHKHVKICCWLNVVQLIIKFYAYNYNLMTISLSLGKL